MRIVCFILLCALVSPTSIPGLSKTADLPALAARDNIPCGNEYVRYKLITAGITKGYRHVITQTQETDNGVRWAKVYHEFTDPDDESDSLPRKLENFSAYIEVIVDSLVMAEHTYNYLDHYKEHNKHGTAICNAQRNAGKGVYIFQSKVWDGYELKTTKSRVKIDPHIPAMDMNCFLFIGVRLIDYSSRGIGLLVNKGMKKPVVGSIKELKKETITTTCGTYETRLIGFYCVDSFLRKMYSSFIDSKKFWVSTGERQLLVKHRYSNGDILSLDAVNTFKNWKEIRRDICRELKIK